MAVKDLEQLYDHLGSLQNDIQVFFSESKNTQRVTPRRLEEYVGRIQRMMEILDSIDKENFDDKQAVADRIGSLELKLKESLEERDKLKLEINSKDAELTKANDIITVFQNQGFIIKCGNKHVQLSGETINKLYQKRIEQDHLRTNYEQLKGMYLDSTEKNQKLRNQIRGLKGNIKGLQNKLGSVNALECEIESLKEALVNKCDETQNELSAKNKETQHLLFKAREKWGRDVKLRSTYMQLHKNYRPKVWDMIFIGQNTLSVELIPEATDADEGYFRRTLRSLGYTVRFD